MGTNRTDEPHREHGGRAKDSRSRRPENGARTITAPDTPKTTTPDTDTHHHLIDAWTRGDAAVVIIGSAELGDARAGYELARELELF